MAQDSPAAKVLGVSGSARTGSITDQAVRTVLDATGCETDFVKLSRYTIAPCLACLGCVETNRCVIDDDGRALADQAREADALVVGCFTPYSTIDARTKAFLERLYPLRHRKGYMAGKPGAAVVTSVVPPGAEQLPPAGEMGTSAVQFYMMEEGMRFLGGVQVSGKIPCAVCGHGDTCATSGVKMIFGPEATVDSIRCSDFSYRPEQMEHARALGRTLGEVLRAGSSPG